MTNERKTKEGKSVRFLKKKCPRIQFYDQPTKQKILDVAIDLFSKKGYSNVSMRDLAKGVGIAQPSIYNHFKSKHELLVVIFDCYKSMQVSNSYSDEEMNEALKYMNAREFLIYFLDWEQVFPLEVSDMMRKIFRIAIMEQYNERIAYELLALYFFREDPKYIQRVLNKLIDAGKIRKVNAEFVAHVLARTAYSFIVEFSHNRNLADIVMNRDTLFFDINHYLFDEMLQLEDDED